MTLVYNKNYFSTSLAGSDDDTLGIVGALIGAAPGIFSAVAGLFGGGRKAQCQGSAEIQSCGQQAVAAMNQLLTGLNSGTIDPQQAVSEAARIVGQFNDPSIVYPAKKGNDAAIRQQFIEQLTALQQQIQAAASNAASQRATAVTVNSQSSNISSTLLLVGGGMLAVMLLTRSD